MSPLVAIVGLAVILVRPALPRVVGDLVWPQLVLLRRFGRTGLFLSWLAYFAVLLVPVLALYGLYSVVGGIVVRRPYDIPLIVGVWSLAAAVFAITGRNPSRALDADLFAAHRLLDDLRQADLERLTADLETQKLTRDDYESVVDGRPSVAFADHLVRILHQVAAAEYPRSYTKTIAIHLIRRRLRKARALGDRASRVAV